MTIDNKQRRMQNSILGGKDEKNREIERKKQQASVIRIPVGSISPLDLDATLPSFPSEFKLPAPPPLCLEAPPLPSPRYHDEFEVPNKAIIPQSPQVFPIGAPMPTPPPISQSLTPMTPMFQPPLQEQQQQQQQQRQQQQQQPVQTAMAIDNTTTPPGIWLLLNKIADQEKEINELRGRLDILEKRTSTSEKATNEVRDHLTRCAASCLSLLDTRNNKNRTFSSA